jgi:hypothetical protein
MSSRRSKQKTHRTSRSPSSGAATAAAVAENVWWQIGLIVLAGALTYANSFSAPFVLDDRATIVENAST